MALTKEDLIQTCPDCEGEGKIYDPPRPKTGSTYGTHSVSGYQNWTSCGRCGMKGEILTEEGEAIAAVVRFVR